MNRSSSDSEDKIKMKMIKMYTSKSGAAAAAHWANAKACPWQCRCRHCAFKVYLRQLRTSAMLLLQA